MKNGTSAFGHLMPALLLAAITGSVAPAVGDAIQPGTIFGVVDNEFDGIPDEFSSESLADAILTRFVERRSFAEFDLTDLGGPIIESATITGVLNEQFTFGFGTMPADFRFDLYNGNGAPDLSDFNIAGSVVGTVTLDEDFETYALELDVTDALQTLVDGGATHAGFRSLTTTDGVGQVDVNDLVLDVTAVPEPASIAWLAGGLLLIRRR